MVTQKIRFKQYLRGQWHYWGFGLPDMGNGFASPMSLQHPSYQFTGMSDRNQREIYAGDIVDVWDNGLCWIVEMFHGAWYVRHGKTRYRLYSVLHPVSRGAVSPLKLIGTSEENPGMAADAEIGVKNAKA